jgi:hypothetical protein
MALKKEQISLKKWSDQKWRTSDGSESKGKKRYLPDKAWDALSPQEKAATNRAKSAGNSKGEQFVAQPDKIADKTSKYRKMNEEVYVMPNNRSNVPGGNHLAAETVSKSEDINSEDLNESYLLLSESRASDIKGNGRLAKMAREYLEKYPTKFTFRANKHVETMERYLGKRVNDVIKLVIGGYYISTMDGPMWKGTAAVAFTDDKIFVAQKGLLFGTETVKSINRDKIDDVQITRGVIYGMFTIHARSEHLSIGVLHKNSLQEMQEFLEMYADSKIRIKTSSEPDLLSKQVVNESLLEAVANLGEDFFAVEVEKAPGEIHSDTIEADNEEDAITKTIEMLGVDVENIRHLQRINEERDESYKGDASKPKKKSEVDDIMDEFSQPKDLGGVIQQAINQSVEEGPMEDDEPEEPKEKYHPDRIVPQEEIDAEEAYKAEGEAYQQQRIAGMKGNTPFIDDYGGTEGKMWFRDPRTGQSFVKKRPIDPATGKIMSMVDYLKQPEWNEPDPEGAKDPVTGEPLVGKDGKPLLNSAPVGEEMYVLTEKLTRPHKGEKKQEFISRFMGTDLAKKEFKDNKQRVAVAYNQWERGRLRESLLREDVPSDESEEEWGRYIARKLKEGKLSLADLDDQYKRYKVDRIIPDEGEKKQTNEGFYTADQLVEAFSAAGLDTRKYTVEYLAEQLGMRRVENLNEDAAKEVLQKIWDGTKWVFKKIILPVGTGYLASRGVWDMVNNPQIPNMIGSAVSVIPAIAGVMKAGQNMQSDEIERLKKEALTQKVRTDTTMDNLDAISTAMSKFQKPQQQISQQIPVQPTVYKPLSVLTAEDGDKKEKLGLEESVTLSFEELNRLLESLNLDTSKYTVDYLAEKLGFQQINEGKWLNKFGKMIVPTLALTGALHLGANANDMYRKFDAQQSHNNITQYVQDNPGIYSLSSSGNFVPGQAGNSQLVLQPGSALDVNSQQYEELSQEEKDELWDKYDSGNELFAKYSQKENAAKDAATSAAAANTAASALYGPMALAGAAKIAGDKAEKKNKEKENEFAPTPDLTNESQLFFLTEKAAILKRYGVDGFNEPKRTPGHKTKSHLVVAKKGEKVKVVRFGAQGAKGSPRKEGESESYRKRREGFVARHKAQNPSGMKDKFSALYWANKVKW